MTIEEIVKSYVEDTKQWCVSNVPFFNREENKDSLKATLQVVERSFYDGIKEGVKYRQKIDIEKANEWLKNNTPLGYWPDRMDEFNKAMEE